MEMLAVLRYDQMASAQTLTTQNRATTDWPTAITAMTACLFVQVGRRRYTLDTRVNFNKAEKIGSGQASLGVEGL